MARKSAGVASKPQVEEALEEARALAELRGEIALEAFNHQDKDTQEVLERIRDTLRLAATGWVYVRMNPPYGGQVHVKLEQEYVDFNLFYIAVEILKTLALFDTRVATFKFPPSLCVNCGAELKTVKRKKVRKWIR
jgi:hypothetical protein